MVYDSKRGYPRQIIYRNFPELRWRYLDYWRSLLSGSLNCPAPNPKNTIATASNTGEMITVLSLTPLKPENAGLGLLPLPTLTLAK